ncbi:MAG TPA: hypothetical protein VFD83_00045 [Candidatus Polarisedimenticolia bacterium]|nr:hypothetical protein [Candidatus Polarisedimenticolia bacterium]
MNAPTPDGAREFLRHAVATLAYRCGKALRGAPDSFATFKAGPTTRTPIEILAHIGDLLDWVLSQAQGQERWRDAAYSSWEVEKRRFHSALAAFDDYLASAETLHKPAERMFQGAIADAIAHTGQLTMLRRLAGSHVRGENYSRADIQAGRVGPEQPPPPERSEFD